MNTGLISFILPFLAATISVGPVVVAQATPVAPVEQDTILAEKQISLENRYAIESVNEVFKDNILLNIAYLSHTVTKSSDVKWDEIRKPFKYEFTLAPNEVFAFHEDVKEEYKSNLVKTTNAHFNYSEGFRTSGLLYGDGVCHLASVIYWAAKDAGLTSSAPTSHNFANIPEISKEYGVSIYYNPGNYNANSLQNLYVQNTYDAPVKFVFKYDGSNLKVSVYKINN